MAGIEVIFFLVAGMVVCFGFSMRIMRVTLWCSVAEQCLGLFKDFSISCAALPVKRLGVHEKLLCEPCLWHWMSSYSCFMLLFPMILSLFLSVCVERRLVISHKTAGYAQLTPVYVALCFCLYFCNGKMWNKQSAMFKSIANFEVLKMLYGLWSHLYGFTDFFPSLLQVKC